MHGWGNSISRLLMFVDADTENHLLLGRRSCFEGDGHLVRASKLCVMDKGRAVKVHASVL